MKFRQRLLWVGVITGFVALLTLIPIHQAIGSVGNRHRVSSRYPPYKSHIHTARGYGIRPIKNTAALKGYVKSKKLRTATCTKGCTIKKLSYSRPYLVPKANKVLHEVSSAFYKKTGSRFTVTSMTRTLSDQQRLSRVNHNARRSISSHNYGCSFDISYVRFNGRKGSNPRLERELQNILASYQRRGELYYIRERHQSCFHVTVRS